MQQTSNDRYFGSDLNKFINEKCTKEMSCINIDCLLLKWSCKQMKIIESKYPSEKITSQQVKILGLLHFIFKSIEVLSNWLGGRLSGWKFSVWIVRGSPPYETSEIIDPRTNDKYTLNQNELIEWLEFRKELN